MTAASELTRAKHTDFNDIGLFCRLASKMQKKKMPPVVTDPDAGEMRYHLLRITFRYTMLRDGVLGNICCHS